MGALDGRVAWVTGGSRGIGRGIALALAKAGADVGVGYLRKEEEALEVVGAIEALGRRAVRVQGDVSREEDVARGRMTVEDRLGPVGILVNNAGIARHKPVDQLTAEDFDRVIAANLRSAFLLCQAVIPGMRRARWGRILNLSSTAAQTGGVVGPHYAASKAGLLGLTHGYATLLAKEGITVNAIAPALIETDMLWELPGVSPEKIPVGRFGKVEECAQIAVALASNGYLTGQTINVNGGLYMS